jgi:ribosomal-protein-alanine N-acetyltransferase
MLIREMNVRDVDRVSEVENLGFARPWSKDMLYSDLDGQSKAVVLVAEVGGRVAGHVGVWRALDELHITTLAVDPDYRRRGIASALMEAVFERYGAEYDEFTLEVRENNFAAINLYEKFGFEVMGRRIDYYLDNREDALVMTLRTAPVGEEFEFETIGEYTGCSG